MSSVDADVDASDDAICTELEKSQNEQDDMAGDSEPLRTNMKSNEVLVQTAEVAASKTPETSAPRTPPRRRQKADPQSPWAQQKVVIPSSGDNQATIMQSKPQRGGVVA